MFSLENLENLVLNLRPESVYNKKNLLFAMALVFSPLIRVATRNRLKNDSKTTEERLEIDSLRGGVGGGG